MQLQIPTADEIRSIFREEIAALSSLTLLQQQIATDEIGGIELAMKITGRAKTTIYTLVSTRQIPHSKRGKLLYFSRNELTKWLWQGKRKTNTELALDAETFLSGESQTKNRNGNKK